ncbi:hypothetical protein Tco_0618868 [Tanacetum coccineum]
MSTEALQAREDLMRSIENFLKKFNRISFRETPKVLMQAWDKLLEIKHAQSEDVQDLINKLVEDVQKINEDLADYELADYINSPSFNHELTSSYDDDDEDEESSTPWNNIISELPPSDLDVSSPSEDRNKIYDPGICIEVESTRFLATLSPVIDTLLPFSSENEDKVFNYGVLASKEKSHSSLSHRGFKASKLFHRKSPMLIHGENTPNLGDFPDCDESRARGFCPSITRASNPQLHLGNPIS